MTCQKRWHKTRALEGRPHRKGQSRTAVDRKGSEQTKTKRTRGWQGSCLAREHQEGLKVYSKHSGQRVRLTAHEQKMPGMGQDKALKRRPLEPILGQRGASAQPQLPHSPLTMVTAPLMWPGFRLLPLMTLKPVNGWSTGGTDSCLAKVPSDIK